jgi:TonB-linked SusC/RagA family outer membrane protein
MKHSLLLLLLGTLCWWPAHAQDRQLAVAGRVTSGEDGLPLPGVSVLLKGTAVGATTNADGRYTLRANPGQTLVFSFVGYLTREVVLAEQSTLDLVLETDTKLLNEVVVTALGIERERRSLGTSIQDIKGSALTQARETNLVNALSGKIAGIQVTGTNGTPGASSRILIRGANSIGNNNQPLFVVDGVPVDNGNYGSTTTVDYGNGASAINPDDIETVSVLKGANAAALYGSRAANGVILITTKSGRGTKGIGVAVNSNVTFERPFRLPEYQNEYGQGSKGLFSYVDGRGGGVADGVDESWGPRLDGRLLPQFNSPIDPATGQRIPTPWIARPDNVRNFHETGRTFTNNVALTGGNDNGDFRLSFTNLNNKGMLPNTGYERSTLSLNAGWNLTPKLTIRAAANYVKDGSDNRQNLNLYWTWFGRQVDLDDLRQFEEPGTDPSQWPVQRSWNFNYWNNPYFALNRFLYANEKDRLYGNAMATYQLAPWLTAMVRSGTDVFTDRRRNQRARGTGVPNGSFSEETYFVRESNSDFLVTANQKFNQLQVTANVGGNRRYFYTQYNAMSAAELNIPNLYNIANSRVQPSLSNRRSEKAVNSLYGSAQLGYRDYLFLDLTARNDWSSTLPAGNRSYFYPSVSASAVVTDILGLDSKWISYGKVRAGWARVGNDTDPYSTQQVFSAQSAWGAVTTFSENTTIFNNALLPEITSAVEFGVETRLFNNFLNLEVTYYDKNSSNQILRVNVPQSSGYVSKFINAGKIRNSGWEVELSATPLKLNSGFRWDVAVNYARNRSEVVDLGGILTYNINTGSLLRNVILEARPGSPYGNFFGTAYLRDPDGNIVFDANGYARTDPQRRVLGNIMPKWTGGLQNTFSFKGLSLSTLLDVRIGGDLFAHSVNIGRYTGVLKETVLGRETGVVGQGTVEVVNPDGSSSYVPNTKLISSEDYHHTFFNRNINETYIFDASYAKLREAKLGYTLPARWFGRTPFRNVNLSVVGRNLLLLYSNVPHIDPETSFYGDGNVQGFENGQLPSARSIGFNVSFNL